VNAPGTDSIYRRLGVVVNTVYDQTLYAKLSSRREDSAKPAELYQLASVLVAVVLVGLGLTSCPAIRAFFAMVAGLRLFDILLFAVWWSFVKAPQPVLNPKRSLAMFLVNLAEVVLWYAVLATAAGCGDSDGFGARFRVLYSSLRTTVTIGPVDRIDNGAGCIVLHMAQIVESYFLMALIVASLVSAIQRSQVKRGEEKGTGHGSG
jgi:hypothetical protein